MKKTLIVILIMLGFLAADSIISNPGIPAYEHLEIKDYINKKVGFVTATVTVTLKTVKGQKYYFIDSKEGNYFQNYITLNYSDLSTVSEKRYTLPDGKLSEVFAWVNKDQIYFYNRSKEIDAKLYNSESIYSRYAYFVALRGFPFESCGEQTIKSYMFEYGNALPINVANLGKIKVRIKAGTFDCYKLEIAVGGWQKYFAPDKYYLYFTVDKPHQFIKFDQKVDTGQWLSNELINYQHK